MAILRLHFSDSFTQKKQIAEMKTSVEKKLLMASALGLSYWFFGNLYEAIVFSPNWVVESPEQIRRLNEFFVRTSPTLYFVPLTQLATILVWIIHWKNKDRLIKKELKLASLFAIFATLINIIIVSTTAIKLFETDYAKYGSYLATLTWRWNILNLFRMVTTGVTIYFLFQSYRKLDRMGTNKNYRQQGV